MKVAAVEARRKHVKLNGLEPVDFDSSTVEHPELDTVGEKGAVENVHCRLELSVDHRSLREKES